MVEVTGDLWDAEGMGQWIVITTNGEVNKKGEAIMGRGIAAEAAKRHPKLPQALGTLLQASGNHVYRFDSIRLFTFPTKHSWLDRRSDLALIIQSAKELVECSPDIGLIYMVRPGCGNGHLTWSTVKPALADILADGKFVVVEK